VPCLHIQTSYRLEELVLRNCTQCVTLASLLKSKAVAEVYTNTVRIFLGHAFITAQMNSRILHLEEKTKKKRRNSYEVFQPGHLGSLGFPQFVICTLSLTFKDLQIVRRKRVDR